MRDNANSTRPTSILFPARADRGQWDDVLTRELGAADERVAAGSVVPTLDIAAFKHELAAFDFMSPRDMDELLAWTISKLEHGIVHVTHPRYFGLFNPAPVFPAQCADRIAAVFNPQLATSKTSPVPVAIEAHVIGAVARRVGLPIGSVGHFTTGGAEANYTALLCALTRSNPSFASEGARAFAGPPVFYISQESHLAWLKVAHQAGIGRSAARLVPTDGSGRMDMKGLADMINADRAKGCVPVMIAATAGTTNAGMIDPLAQTAQIARAAGAWFHVDAAWGGAAAASEKLRPLLAGIELADSITIDAHKWFATTMGCGMFITRDASILSSTFHVSFSLMPSNVTDLDPYITTVQWSRRFLGLRLFLALAAAGWSGYASHVEHAVELVELLRDRLQALGWRTPNGASLAILCVEPPPGSCDVRSIVARVLASKAAWISVANFEGRDIIRVCVTHGQTTPEDIARLVDELEAAK